MKKIPSFKNEDQARSFWATRDSADYVDWKKAKRVHFPRLKPTLQSISLRLPKMMLEEIRMLANKRDVPYQSLLKTFLAERLTAELKNISRRVG